MLSNNGKIKYGIKCKLKCGEISAPPPPGWLSGSLSSGVSCGEGAAFGPTSVNGYASPLPRINT
jgi:hypothetical protein